MTLAVAIESQYDIIFAGGEVMMPYCLAAHLVRYLIWLGVRRRHSLCYGWTSRCGRSFLENTGKRKGQRNNVISLNLLRSLKMGHIPGIILFMFNHRDTTKTLRIRLQRLSCIIKGVQARRSVGGHQLWTQAEAWVEDHASIVNKPTFWRTKRYLQLQSWCTREQQHPTTTIGRPYTRIQVGVPKTWFPSCKRYKSQLSSFRHDRKLYPGRNIPHKYSISW